ncbi:MAG: DmsC/YnfH family molybdoenzyme membrane anchor subunit [Pseudorhodobacter sp.]|nr:DmsC/YnfH family molybdoenzyme membrane anchor subunit [Pseudorhodobacter sp.]
MHPAASVILFTVLSGLGFGYLALLGLGVAAASGWVAFAQWGLGYGLTVGGLLASTLHLGQPRRALLAFSQWRSSWLSREAWAAVASLMVLAPMALSDGLGLGWPRAIGGLGAGLAVATLGCTAMIYAQLRTVPRWNHWLTPALLIGFAATGGAILAQAGVLAVGLCLGLAVLLGLGFRLGDGLFAARGLSLASATGLGRIGTPAVFEQPHTGGNYLTREMIHVVGRRHAQKLRVIAVIGAGLLPALILLALPAGWPATALALVVHLVGAIAARWLFFAEAEHVVGLYYGQR